MKPESSATTMRGLRSMEGELEPVFRALALGRRGEVDPAEQTVEVEQDDQAVVDLHDAVDRLAAAGRDRVELALLDRQDLVDAVHDDTGGDRAALDDHDLAAVGCLGHEA